MSEYIEHDKDGVSVGIDAGERDLDARHTEFAVITPENYRDFIL